MKRGWQIVWSSLAAFTLGFPSEPLWGQSSSLTSEPDLPPWLTAWSPLKFRSDLPRSPPATGFGVASPFLPGPRVGTFWTTGNPAGLAAELSDSRSDFALTVANRTGTYRRPLDPVSSNLKQASALGWRPLTPRFALLGRVVLDQERFEPGTRADLLEPYSSSPFVTIDTSSSATRRTRVRLEGVGSWQLGKLGLGLSLGAETLANETIEAGLARRSRLTMPGAIVGFGYRLGSTRLGGYGGWRNRAETLRLIEVAANGEAIELQGLHEPTVIDIVGDYYRRLEENARAAGVSVSGRLGETAWAFYGERGWLRERLFRQEVDNPDSDRWHSEGWASGLDLQRGLGGRRQLTIHGRYATLRGSGELALDTSGTVFRARERTISGSAELRVSADSSRWGLLVAALVGHENRVRDDLRISLGSRVSGLTMGLCLQLARALSARVTITGVLAYANYSAKSAYPAPAVLGQLYRSVILPELDLMARQSRPYQGSLGLRWRAWPGTFLWVAARGERLEPFGSSRGPTPYSPNGARSTVAVSVGVTMQ